MPHSRRKLLRGASALPLWAAALFSLALMAGLVLLILARGLPELGRLIAAREGWLLSCTLNTAILILLSLIPAVPVAIGAAAWLAYFAPVSVKRAARALLEAVSGLPSILFGMFGYLLFGSLLGLRYSLLTGALTLSVMLLPGAVLAFWEALSQVERPLLESALGLGAGLASAVKTVIVPSAAAGLFAGTLGLARQILGESAALIFTSGVGAAAPGPGAAGLIAHLRESGASIAVQLYRLVLDGENGPAFGAAAFLLLLAGLLSFAARLAAERGRRR